MALNLREENAVTRTDRIHVSRSDIPAENFHLDETTLRGSNNTGNIGWQDTAHNSNDWIVIPRGSVVGVNSANQVTLPGAPYTAANTAVATAKKSPTDCGPDNGYCAPIGVVENDVIYYNENVTNSYPAGRKKSDHEGAKAVFCQDYIELPIVIASGTENLDVSVAPNVVKWGCLVTTDVANVYPGVYLDVNGYGQFLPQVDASADKGSAYAQVLYVWNSTQKSARFMGAMSFLARRGDYVIGTDGVPPIETVQNSTNTNPYIIPNAAFGDGDQPSSYIVMARLRLLF